ncbi:MAG TPA: GNAT family N-acetyltransferase [Solirubrobacteraceae bacterium]|nr:GNAT family N-acetyltransferase [Solirubrobacteraceae bacterium]
MFELRRAGVEDAETIYDTVQIGFHSFRAWAGPDYDPPPEAMELARIREGLARPATWALLALSGGKPAGHVAITQARERAEPRPDIPGLCHFWMLFVRPPWWGSGLAARLNALAVERAAEQGYEAMRLHTPAGNARSRAFYEREGWHTDGVAIPEPLLGLDLVEYRRDL